MRVVVDGRLVPVNALPPAPDVMGFDATDHPGIRRGYTIRYTEVWPFEFVPDAFNQPAWCERTTLYTVERVIGRTAIGRRATES